jgi:PAS domain S-box-containing protein
MQEQNLTIIRTWLIIGTVATMAATFTADLLLPLGIAAGVPYVIAILIAYWLHDTRSTLVIAAVCTLLVLAGYFASPAGGELWKVIVNRGLAIGAIWITTWLSLSAEWSNRRVKINEQKTKAIIDNAVDGMITIDEMGNINAFNPAAEKMFGYSIEEIFGKNIKILMPEPYKSEHDQYLDNYRRSGVRKIIGIGREVEGLRKDGTTFPVELAVSEAQSTEGRVFFGTIRDITERQEAENKLKESEERTRAIVDTAVDGIITIDEQGILGSFNPAAEKMFGYSIDEVIGRNINMLMPEPYHSEHDQYLDNYRRTGVKKIIGIGREVEGLRKDGTTFK